MGGSEEPELDPIGEAPEEGEDDVAKAAAEASEKLEALKAATEAADAAALVLLALVPHVQLLLQPIASARALAEFSAGGMECAAIERGGRRGVT